MAREAGDRLRPAEQQARLRPAEQLVAAGGDQPGAGPQPRVRIGLIGENRARPEQAGPDIADHECSQRGAVGGAHLADPGAGGLQQVGKPESVADLDQLAAADDDLAPGGQRRGRQDQRGGVVVDHVHRPGRRNRPRESVKRASAAAAAPARVQVEFHVRAARRGPHRLTRCRRQRCPAEIGVHQNAGRVDHRGQGRGGRRQRRGRGAGDARRADGPGPGQLLGAGDRLLDQRRAEQLPGRDQARVGEHDVSSRHVTARVHSRDPTPPRPLARPRAESVQQRRRTGIEPADDAVRRPPVLKTGGATRHPDASGADVTCAQAARAIGARCVPDMPLHLTA